MLLEDALEEYFYHCKDKGFTQKTMKNKRQEFKADQTIHSGKISRVIPLERF
ncbi:hypothetical protein [Peribacillus glennii]|uniref:hypothetical protein n=1 Tax=Peribacillus glennii TaxID=2303991 RepID=UPI001F4003EA|nr:hypothetical protein [Peribacillus glennii]